MGDWPVIIRQFQGANRPNPLRLPSAGLSEVRTPLRKPLKRSGVSCILTLVRA